MDQESVKRIQFKFRLLDQETGGHIVEKTEGGVKHRYIRGISSGILVDGDGERMTMNAIKSMQEQAQQGDILLYKARHGVDFSEDIGILTYSEIINDQDWYTEYRLYDETDGMGPNTLEYNDKIYRQIAGLPPYMKKREYGFSVEGTIPQNGIISAQREADGGVSKRVIDKIDLDGVVLVAKPSYSNVSTAVYKALGELHPDNVEKLKDRFSNSFTSLMQEQEAKDNYYRSYYQMTDVLNDEIERIMSRRDGRESERLVLLFAEYGPAMIELILQNEGAFQRAKGEDNPQLENGQNMDEVYAKAKSLIKMLHSKLGGKQ